jgi:uncharacterized protein YkwD
MPSRSRLPTLAVSALTLVIFCQPAFAQEGKSQPVARLISASALTPRANVTTSVSPPAGPSLAEANEIERRAFEQTNIVRLQNGLPPFSWDAEVCRMARTHSESMSRLNYFSHVTPDRLRLRDRARAAGIFQFSVLGENIAYNQGYDDPGAVAVERWMLSPKHRANILSPEFRAMAIGSFVASDGSVYLTQTFITR